MQNMEFEKAAPKVKLIPNPKARLRQQVRDVKRFKSLEFRLQAVRVSSSEFRLQPVPTAPPPKGGTPNVHNSASSQPFP